MMSKIFLLLPISFLLSLSLLTQPNWPSLFSQQNPINPKTISESYDPDARIAYFDNHSVTVPSIEPSAVLGEGTPSSNKRIEVNLTEQKVYAYENDKLLYTFIISSGKWGRTHPGTYAIWSKVRSQKMSGGSKALGTYYYLPNVPYIMFFYNSGHSKAMGYSLHGTYWHNNFGVPMSHGCVNMKTPDASTLFGWAEVGTPIVISGKYEYKTASK